MHALRVAMRIVVCWWVLQCMSGCAAVGASYGVEGAYNSAFRIKIEDVSKLPEEEQGRLGALKFVESAAPGSLPKGEVAGLACKLTVALLVFRWTWLPELNEKNGRTPEEAARTQLLLKAMRNGANAVAAPGCTHKDGIDWGNNCFESWVCKGQAVLTP